MANQMPNDAAIDPHKKYRGGHKPFVVCATDRINQTSAGKLGMRFRLVLQSMRRDTALIDWWFLDDATAMVYVSQGEETVKVFFVYCRALRQESNPIDLKNYRLRKRG